MLLTRNSAITVRTDVTAGIITRTIRSIKSEVRLGKEDGMTVPCIVNLDDIVTIPKSIVSAYITTLSQEKMVEVDKAIRFALDL